MNKLLQYPIQVNANFGALLKQVGNKWLSWTETQPAPKLSAHIQYDIGENDCRPLQSKPDIPYSATFEAMLYRSI
jgi:hypothetical protein